MDNTAKKHFSTETGTVWHGWRNKGVFLEGQLMLHWNVCPQSNIHLPAGKQLFGYRQICEKNMNGPTKQYELLRKTIWTAPQNNMNGTAKRHHPPAEEESTLQASTKNLDALCRAVALPKRIQGLWRNHRSLRLNSISCHTVRFCRTHVAGTESRMCLRRTFKCVMSHASRYTHTNNNYLLHWDEKQYLP